MIVNLKGKDSKTFELKINNRVQHIAFNHGQFLNEEYEPGKTLLANFPSYCDVKEDEETQEVQPEPELLVEEPIEKMEVQKEDVEDAGDIEETQEEDAQELPTLESFGKGKEAKSKMEEFGKTLGIDLNKQFSLANMYKQLQEHKKGIQS